MPMTLCAVYSSGEGISFVNRSATFCGRCCGWVAELVVCDGDAQMRDALFIGLPSSATFPGHLAPRRCGLVHLSKMIGHTRLPH